MILNHLRRLTRWVGRHPVIACQVANFAAVGSVALWLQSYAYSELPLEPFNPVCYDEKARDYTKKYREIKGELTEEFAQAVVADFVHYDREPIMVSHQRLFVTGRTDDTAKLIEQYGSEVSKLKERWYISSGAMERVFMEREGMEYVDLVDSNSPEDTIMHKKYGMPITSIFGLTDCTFMKRVMIVGGDLNLPEKIYVPKEDADQ